MKSTKMHEVSEKLRYRQNQKKKFKHKPMLCSTAYENPGVLSRRTPDTEVSLDNHINIFNMTSTQTETLSQKSLNQILIEVLNKAKF